MEDFSLVALVCIYENAGSNNVLDLEGVCEGYTGSREQAIVESTDSQGEMYEARISATPPDLNAMQ